MNLPLYTVATGSDYYDCYTSDDVRRVLRRLGEKDIFHRPPTDTIVFLYWSHEDVTTDFIKN